MLESRQLTARRDAHGRYKFQRADLEVLAEEAGARSNGEQERGTSGGDANDVDLRIFADFAAGVELEDVVLLHGIPPGRVRTLFLQWQRLRGTATLTKDAIDRLDAAVAELEQRASNNIMDQQRIERRLESISTRLANIERLYSEMKQAFQVALVALRR